MNAHHFLGWSIAGSTGLSLLITPFVLKFARAWGLVDLPNARKVHSLPTPRVGGVAIVAAMLLSFAAVWWLRLHSGADAAQTRVVAATLAGGFFLALVGLADDIWGISAKFKLLALVMASLGFCAAGGAVDTVIVSGLHVADLGIAAWPLTILWIVVVCVAIAFIDGLDGLAGGIGALAAGVLVITASVGGDGITAALAATLAGALLGFLFFNYNPAKIFMGDTGAMFLGFMLATLTAGASPHVGTTRALVLPALALTIPLFDLLFTMMRRGILQRRSLFAAERGHIHHQLLDMGLCHLHAVMLLHLLTIGGAIVAVVCLFCGYITSTICIVAYCLGLAALFRVAGTLQARSLVGAIRRNRAIGRSSRKNQNAFYDLQLRFRHVNSFESWWQTVCHAADIFGFAKLDLPLTDREGNKSVRRWRRDGQELASDESITAEIPVPQRRSGELLRAQVEVAVNDTLESAGHRVALFSRLMGEHGLDQLRPESVAAPADEPIDASPAGPFKDLRVAVVHDFLYTYAGAERVLEQMLTLVPHAELFSLFDFVPADKRQFLRGKVSKPSFLQKMPLARSRHRAYLPLMPLAIEQLDVSEYDLILSSSYVAAKGVLTRSDQLHICYCHTPVRFAWELQKQYLAGARLVGGLRGLVAKLILHYIRAWDVRSANGVDAFLCNSNFVRRRIQKIYRRNANVIYPPVDTAGFHIGDGKRDFYLAASRLVPYKRMDLIISAFAQMPGRNLVVIGEGPELSRLTALARPFGNIRVLGHQPQDVLRQHMQQAKGFIFAAEEDFGIVSVEAQACGTPVIAFGRGGSLETVIDNVTGVHFPEQTCESLMAAIDRFEKLDFDRSTIRSNAERFSVEKFHLHLQQFIAREWEKFTAAGGRISAAHDKPASTHKTIWRDVVDADFPRPRVPSDAADPQPL